MSCDATLWHSNWIRNSECTSLYFASEVRNFWKSSRQTNVHKLSGSCISEIFRIAIKRDAVTVMTRPLRTRTDPNDGPRYCLNWRTEVQLDGGTGVRMYEWTQVRDEVRGWRLHHGVRSPGTKSVRGGLLMTRSSHSEIRSKSVLSCPRSLKRLELEFEIVNVLKISGVSISRLWGRKH